MAISTLLRWRGHIPQRLRVCGWSWRGWSGSAVDALAVRGQERAGRGGRLECADVEGGEPRGGAIPLVVAGGRAYLRVGHTLSGPQHLGRGPAMRSRRIRDGDQSSRSGLVLPMRRVVTMRRFLAPAAARPCL